ncbi:MAG: hypothetical protein ABIN08_12515 [Caldimonas sp.]
MSGTSDSEETAKGHGTVSVGYQNTYINGMFQPVPGGKIHLGSIRVQSISFNLEYFVAYRWSVHWEFRSSRPATGAARRVRLRLRVFDGRPPVPRVLKRSG